MSDFNCNLWAHVLGGLHSFSGVLMWVFVFAMIAIILRHTPYRNKSEEESAANAFGYSFIFFVISFLLWSILPAKEIALKWCQL